MSCFNVTKKRETDAAQISVCSDGIIRVMFKKRTEVNQHHFKQLFDVYNELVEGERFPFLYYAEDSSVIVSEDGRAYAKNEEYSFPKVCNAVIVSNLAHKLIANFYFKFNKPSYPFRVFSKMQDAEKWCLEEFSKIQKAELSLK
jgi:hypothetical protein